MFLDQCCFHNKENRKNKGTKGEHHGAALEMAGKWVKGPSGAGKEKRTETWGHVYIILS